MYEPNWTANTVTSSVDGPLSIFSNDLDGDGDIDVLSASSGDDKVAWYQNNGSESFTKYTISSKACLCHLEPLRS